MPTGRQPGTAAVRHSGTDAATRSAGGQCGMAGHAPVQQAASLAPCEGAEEARLNLLGSDSGLKSGNSAVYGTTISGLGYALDTDAAFSGGWPASGAIAAGRRQISLRTVVTGPLSSGVLTAETPPAAPSTAKRCWISPCKNRSRSLV